MKPEWPEGCDGWASLRLVGMLVKLKADEWAKAVEFLSHLDAHLFTHSPDAGPKTRAVPPVNNCVLPSFEAASVIVTDDSNSDANASCTGLDKPR